MSVGEKVKKWFMYEDDEEGILPEKHETQKTSMFETPKSEKASNVLRALDASNISDVSLFEPRSFSDGRDIGELLCTNNAAIVNLHRLQKDQSKRITDFLTGVIFAIDGDIQVIGPKIFLCTPKNFRVQGSIELEREEGEEE
ncbi:cell division protein SepF [Tannockella kyphosi]|uniref:cell division protein SepF n=1 Tax=Tannockella kyphosi TaxID=2899121 RepID=UPI0020113E2D|nr:cell division protein SepF [Tannockella kyphosi]